MFEAFDAGSLNPDQFPLLHSVSAGSGSPLVLVHGMAASLRDWAAVLPALAQHGFSAYAVDLIGHGDSPKPEIETAYQVEFMYQAFQAWMSALPFDEPVTLVGHSLGGYLSLLHAMRHPETVRALVLVDPLYSPNQLSPLLNWMRHRPHLGVRTIPYVPAWFVDKVSELGTLLNEGLETQELLRMAADYRRASPKILYIPRTIEDLTGKLAQVNKPSLVVWGKQDRTLNPVSFETLVQRMPQAYGQALPGFGHHPHLANSSKLNELIVDFVRHLES